MSERLQYAEKAVSDLSPDELKEFAAWFMDYDQVVWEQQIAQDASVGLLGFLRQEASDERKAGKLRDL